MCFVSRVMRRVTGQRALAVRLLLRDRRRSWKGRGRNPSGNAVQPDRRDLRGANSSDRDAARRVVRGRCRVREELADGAGVVLMDARAALVPEPLDVTLDDLRAVVHGRQAVRNRKYAGKQQLKERERHDRDPTRPSESAAQDQRSLCAAHRWNVLLERLKTSLRSLSMPSFSA